MQYVDLSVNPNSFYKIAFLVPDISKPSILEKHYIKNNLDVLDTSIMAYKIFPKNNKGKKSSATQIREHTTELMSDIKHLSKLKTLIVTSADYFKELTKKTHADKTIGNYYPCFYDDTISVFYCPDYSRIFYDPTTVTHNIERALKAVIDKFNGVSKVVGANIIKHAEYPSDNKSIFEALKSLLKMEKNLTVDIETFSLKHYDAGIASITFCWNEHSGISFPVDTLDKNKNIIPNYRIRSLLKAFFISFKHKAIYHNVCFDVYILIYQLFMDKGILDQEGLLTGLDVMLRNFECTQIMSYLSTNSCSGNKLGLKYQAQEFSGDYAIEDIKDVSVVPIDKLLEYNLIDGLSTYYVFKKHAKTMVADNQVDVYKTIFKPAVVDIIQMQLTGIPIDMDKVLQVEKTFTDKVNKLSASIDNNPVTIALTHALKEQFVELKNDSYKVKRIDINDPMVDDIKFNPNSSKNLISLLYHSDFLDLPIINYTDSKAPSTSGDTLTALVNTTKDKNTIELLENIIELKAVGKMLSTFIPAFKKAQKSIDKWHYLHGNYRLGGTVSGRLSSNSPNLTNIPSKGSNATKSSIAKEIKHMFAAPKGWLMVGIDFDSLEDKISALTTKDPNKLSVYTGFGLYDVYYKKSKVLTASDNTEVSSKNSTANTVKELYDNQLKGINPSEITVTKIGSTKGYDGHCLRAYSYFKDQMPDITEELNRTDYTCTIDEHRVTTINSIAKLYPDLRQKSKNPTFALTYQGTYITLMKDLGFTKVEAKSIESNYHELYEASDKWVKDRLQQATDDGYVTLAFGLRLRTPILKQVVYDINNTPFEAAAEGRTAGNALGQSWCMLNNRAASEFMNKVRNSKYKYDIKPIMHIHDAQYYLIRDNVDVIEYLNNNLVEAIKWQDDPLIQHDIVKMSGKVEIFHPNWNYAVTLPNNCSKSDMKKLMKNHLKDI